MKQFVYATIFIVFFCCKANAQGDTLSIKLKSGVIEKIEVAQIQKIQFTNLTDIVETKILISNLILQGNHPNPITDETEIEFEIASAGSVEINIFDISGSLIQVLRCSNCSAGKNILIWNCMDKENQRANSGIYFYEVRFNNEIQMRKMIVIK